MPVWLQRGFLPTAVVEALEASGKLSDSVMDLMSALTDFPIIPDPPWWEGELSFTNTLSDWERSTAGGCLGHSTEGETG